MARTAMVRAGLLIGVACLAALSVACGGGSDDPEPTTAEVEQAADDSSTVAQAESANQERSIQQAPETPAEETTTETPTQGANNEQEADEPADDPAQARVAEDDGATVSDATPTGGYGSDGYAFGGGAAGSSGDQAPVAEVENAAAAEEAGEADEQPETAEEPRRPLVVIDPGHGGFNTGAVAFGIVERDSNLDFAFRVEQLLIELGYDVILTRRTADRTAEVFEANLPDAPHFVLNRRDLQARVDLANEAGADLYVAIHSNGAADPNASGIEVYWDGQRPHSAENKRLALALQESVLESLKIGTGYQAWDRGIREDSCWNISARTGDCSPIFILGPPQEIERGDVIRFGLDPEALGFDPGQDVIVTRATQMPAALVELLFISNEWEAGVLKDETARQAMAIGIARGILRYFSEQAAVAEQGPADEAGPSEGVAAGAG